MFANESTIPESFIFLRINQGLRSLIDPDTEINAWWLRPSVVMI
jgi:hypothetical protein